MANDWKEAHDKAKEYIADLEKANVKLRDQAIKYLDWAETGERWKQAALLIGEQLSGVGPNGYYEFTPDQWKEWAKTRLDLSDFDRSTT